ncbi:MAG: DNA topoisomerase (ATP-hydrolyzing) subunit B [Xanthobacteraceae bacterium]
MTTNYTGEQIEVLRGLEAVRKRPGMYIGNTAERGLHQLVYEAVDNAVDEALAGYARNVGVVLYKDGSCSVADDGRGIPIDVHAEEKLPAVEVVMTILHAGAKFGKGGYKVSGGLHGVGISVVNALSEWMITEVKRDGFVWLMKFERGVTVQKLKKIGRTDGAGTVQWFKPDPEIFEVKEFHWDILQKRLRELAFLNRGLSITLRDERGEAVRERNYTFDGGIVSFVEWLNEKKDPLHPIISTHAERDGVDVEVAMQYTGAYADQIFSYANNIGTIEGGMHLQGFRQAVTNAVNTYARKRGMLKESDSSLSTDDIVEGLTAVVSVKLQDPQFEGQTKTKLGNARARSIVAGLVSERLDFFLEENPKYARAIIEKCMQAQRARDAAKKARDLSRRKNALEGSGLPGKLVDCKNTNAAESELFLVEGDSAGGTAKGGRDPNNQAILPLRGKILNVEKARLDKVLANEEIRTMITALGTGFGDEFNVQKLRYHKIIIMTDADVDGAHIRTLLLTFFYRQMREIIDGGHLYIAQPPLYKIARGKSEQYLKDERALENYLIDTGIEDAVLRLSSGETLAGNDLRKLVEDSRTIRNLLRGLHSRYNRQVVEQAAILSVLNREIFGDPQKAMAAVPYIAKRLDALSEETERGWQGQFTEGSGFQFERTVRGVKEVAVLDQALLGSADARKLDEFAPALQKVFPRPMPPAMLRRKDEDIPIHGPVSLFEAVTDAGRKGVSLQRYKGLGEMNPSQLWETTLDTNARTMLQVSVKEIDEANTIFDELMGDKVEPRRVFIEAHALAASVDV